MACRPLKFGSWDLNLPRDQRGLVASIGVEPIRPCGRRILNPLRLPIPPRGLLSRQCIIGRFRRNRLALRLTQAAVVALLAPTHAVVPATFAPTFAGPYGLQPVVRTIVGTLPR